LLKFEVQKYAICHGQPPSNTASIWGTLHEQRCCSLGFVGTSVDLRSTSPQEKRSVENHIQLQVFAVPHSERQIRNC
jgi:hypothetical protein